MIGTIIKSMMVTSLRDKISLFYATLFPLGLFIGLGLYFDSAEYRPALLTGVIALGTLFWAMTGQAFQVMQQRNKGVYKLLRLTPYPAASFILAMTLARTMLGLMMSGIILLAGVLVFGISVTFQGLLLACAVLAVGSLCFTCLGFLVANISNNEGQINMYGNLFYLPMVFGSEAFYSLDNAPPWIAAVGSWFPFAHLVEGLNPALGGDGSGILTPIMILIGFTAACLVLAAFTFRWDAEQPIIGGRA